MADKAIRVILADDHGIVLDGLQRLFQREADFAVVACCRNGAEALGAARRGGADVMVLDIRMPGLGGLDVLRAVMAERLACRVALLTAAVNDTDAVEALRLGALGLVLKESSADALLECVRHVHRGQQWVDRDTMNRAVGRMLRQERAAVETAQVLTARETEIVQLIAQGHRNRAVAERLKISDGTVKIHLHNIYKKLGVDGRLELMLWVQERGMN